LKNLSLLASHVIICTRPGRRPNSLILKSILFGALMFGGFLSSLQAQVALYSKPVWWFGASGAANFDFHRGTTQQLNAAFTAPAAFHEGDGIGLFLAPLVELHLPGTRWGITLQAAYDNRKGSFRTIIPACNCQADLTTNLSYLTVEPGLRFDPFKSSFYLFGGPRLAFNLDKSFTYKEGSNPNFPDRVANPDMTSDFGNIQKTLISMQIGAGYDIPLSLVSHHTQSVFSPFISFQPYFGQSPRANETWNLTTLRIGAALKFGCGNKITTPAAIIIPNEKVRFSIISPRNIPVERRVRETFPLRNYVFFDLGSTEIPDRYVMLGKDQVKDFKEDQLEVFTPKRLSGRSRRGMTVYYNVLNILGDRLGKNPATTITLVGSSEKGPEDGRAMAESIERYLVGVFGIDATRISIEGRDKPKIPSEKPGATRELELLRAGDRRVSIESNSPALLMEFQSGPNAPLKPVEIDEVLEAPLESYVSFNVAGAKENLRSWLMEIRDSQGAMKYFGPYVQEQVSIPGKAILGTEPEGDYKITMIGQTTSGNTLRQEATVHMALWTPPENEQGARFSVIFGFNESKAIDIYKKYLTDIVAPKIPKGATVLVHGYTDVIGEELNNQKLSLARAHEVKSILEKSLLAAGRKDVTFEVYGFGEDETLSPFENTYPEERFYNRTVIIDIIPR
jgi:outer membrane protein OmpA-like peptidoglycan-associated protein